jgi:hypothetical protein
MFGIRVKSVHRGSFERERLRIQRIGQVAHVESEPAEAANVFSDMRAGTCNQVWSDGMTILGHGGQHLG